MRIYITALMLATTLGLVSCGGGNETTSTGTPVVAQATIAPISTACVDSMTYGGTGPLLTATTAPTLAQCADALSGYAFGNPWDVGLNGGCAKSKSFGGTEPLLLFAQKDACIYALDNAKTIEMCYLLGGKFWKVGRETGGCDAGINVPVPD
jgi:hypothetical protein